MIHHLNRAAGLCLTAALLLTAAGCGQQTVPESPSPSPVVETAAADKNELNVVRSMELQYANNFAVDYCANGCKIITDGAGQKFLWVPEGGEAPDDTGDMTVLQAPLTKLGCFSTTHATLFHAIGALDKVSLVTTDKDKWHIEQVAQQIEDGTTTYVGKNSAPDYELISAAAPQIILISANTMHGSDEVLAKLDELGIPDVQEMTWKRKKLLSLMVQMDNYSDYLLLWSPRDKKLWYLDIEHEEFHPLAKWDDFIADPGRYLNGMIEGEFEK